MHPLLYLRVDRLRSGQEKFWREVPQSDERAFLGAGGGDYSRYSEQVPMHCIIAQERWRSRPLHCTKQFSNASLVASFEACRKYLERESVTAIRGYPPKFDVLVSIGTLKSRSAGPLA